MEHKKKKKTSFKIHLRRYIAVLVLLTIIATIYVYNTLKKYEKNQVENYVLSVVDDLKSAGKKKKIKNQIGNISVKTSDFEEAGASVEDGLNKLLSSDCEITYKLNKDSKDELKPVYDIYINGNKIFEIGLDGTKTETRLSLLTFSNWKTRYINVEAEDGLVKYEIAAPSNYDIYVNNKKLGENEITTSNEDEGLAQISKYVEIPYAIKYEVKGLIKEPTVKIYDSKKNEVNYSDIKTEEKVIECETEEEAKKEISNLPKIMNIAENWSLFLSNDLKGTRHGFSTISSYLIKDSALYEYAYKWATNVDITFISNHTLKNPAFTNEKIGNFKIYNKNAFSCEVSLDKNMRLANGNELTDSMNERMYFAYYEDESGNKDWKLVNMQSLGKNK